MISRTRVTSGLVGIVVLVSALAAPVTARASEEGRRNTALALGAASAYLLLKNKNKVPGIVAAGAAAYAYKRYDDAFRDRKDRERYWGYRYDGDRYNRYSRYDNDRYYQARYDEGDDRRYYRSRRSSPPGWSRGEKKGWHKHNKHCRD